MGDAYAMFCEKRDLTGIKLDAMGMPHIVANPADICSLVSRTAPKPVVGISDIIVIFSQVGVQHHALIPGQHRSVLALSPG